MRSAFLTALCVAEMRISSSGRAFSLTSTSNEAAVKSLCVDEADAWRETHSHTPAKQVPPTRFPAISNPFQISFQKICPSHPFWREISWKWSDLSRLFLAFLFPFGCTSCACPL